MSYIRFLFITGVSKFSKVSIFSDLSDLFDITLNPNYASLLGYTQTELEHSFASYIAQTTFKPADRLLPELQLWYNGYDFSGEDSEKVYNPFSILSFFESGKFGNYWFSTGTPTFLIKQLVEKRLYDVDQTLVDEITLSKSDIEQLDLVTLLYQTGYLTIKEKVEFDIYRLGYPNKEVRNAMLNFLLTAYTHTDTRETKPLILNLKQSLEAADFEACFEHLNQLFAKIPYDIFEDHLESYYHSIIFLTFTLLGYYVEAESHTSKGRIDAVVKTKHHVHIFEFKIDDNAQAALQQIKDRKYYQKYDKEQRTIYLIGVACQQKEIKDYLVEKV